MQEEGRVVWSKNTGDNPLTEFCCGLEISERGACALRNQWMTKPSLAFKVEDPSTRHKAPCSIPAGQGEEGRLKGKEKYLRAGFVKTLSSFSVNFS